MCIHSKYAKRDSVKENSLNLVKLRFQVIFDRLKRKSIKLCISDFSAVYYDIMISREIVETTHV